MDQIVQTVASLIVLLSLASCVARVPVGDVYFDDVRVIAEP